jgi:hypothetical protein
MQRVGSHDVCHTAQLGLARQFVIRCRHDRAIAKTPTVVAEEVLALVPQIGSGYNFTAPPSNHEGPLCGA